MKLTKQRVQQLKNHLQQYPKQNPEFLYVILEKQSKSSFFQNRRLLWLNLKQKTINYCNVLDDQPFANDILPKPKGTIKIDNDQFHYQKLDKKLPALKLWESKTNDNSQKQCINWTFYFSTQEVLTNLSNTINQLQNCKTTDVLEEEQNNTINRSNNELRQNNQVMLDEENQHIHNKQGKQYEISSENKLKNQQEQFKNLSQNNYGKQNSLKSSKMKDSKLMDSKLMEKKSGKKSSKILQKSSQNYMQKHFEDNGQKWSYSPINSFQHQQNQEQSQQQSLQSIQSHQPKQESQKKKHPNVPPLCIKSILQKNGKKQSQISINQNEDLNCNGQQKSSFKKSRKINQNIDSNYTYEEKMQENSKFSQIDKFDQMFKEKIQGIYEQDIYYSNNKDQKQYKNIYKNRQKMPEGSSEFANNKQKMNLYTGQGTKQAILKHSKESKINEDNYNEDYNKNYHYHHFKHQFQQITKKQPDYNKNMLLKSYEYHQQTQQIQLSSPHPPSLQSSPSEHANLNIVPQFPHQLSPQLPTFNLINTYLPHEEHQIDWNYIFQEQNYSLQIYQQFVRVCHQIIQQNIFGSSCTDERKNLLMSDKIICINELNGIIFTVYKYGWINQKQEKKQSIRKKNAKEKGKNRYEYIFEAGTPPVINFQEATQKNILNEEINYLYFRIYEQLQFNINVWKSNQLITQCLLNNKMQYVNNINSDQINQKPLIQRVCPSICCYAQYFGYHIHCEAKFSKQHYQCIQHWQNNQNIKSALKDLQKMVHVEISMSCLQFYQMLDNKKGKNKTFYIRVINPIQLLVPNNDSKFSSYLNSISIKKYSIPPASFSPSSSQSSLSFSLSSAFSKTFQQLLYTQLQSILSPLINTVLPSENPSEIFAISGAEDYDNLLEYFNITKPYVADLFLLVDVLYWRKIIASEICADVFVILLKYSLHQKISMFYREQCKGQGNSNQEVQNIQIDIEKQYMHNCQKKEADSKYPKFNQYTLKNYDIFAISEEMIHTWLDYLISYNHPVSEILWKQIAQVVKSIYGIDCSNKKESTMPGYLLDFVMRKLGIEINYQNKNNKGTKEKSGDVHQERINQFPQILFEAYSQPNILTFLLKSQLTDFASSGKSKSAKQYKHQPSNLKKSENLKMIEFKLKMEKYRGSCFNKQIKNLEWKVLNELVNLKLVSKYSACVVACSSQYDESSSSFASYSIRKHKSTYQKQSINVLEIVSKLHSNSQFPPYLHYLENYIKLYLTQQIQYQNKEENWNLIIYDTKQLPILSTNQIIRLVPHCSIKLQTYFQILKQIIKYSQVNSQKKNERDDQQLLYIFNCILQFDAFWGGEFNPYMMEAYSLLIDYFFTVKDFKEAIRLYKSYMLILLTEYPNSMLIIDKYAFLGEMLASTGKYVEAAEEIELGIIRLEEVLKELVIQTKEYKLSSSLMVGSACGIAEEKQKILMLKFIRCSIKRSQILLKVYRHNSNNQNCQQTNNNNNQSYFARNFWTKNGTGQGSTQSLNQIIQPLLFIVNEIKSGDSVSKQPDTSHILSPYRSKQNRELDFDHKSQLAIIRINELNISQITWQITQILEIISRSYIIANKNKQLDNFINDFVLDNKFLNQIWKNISNFEVVLKLFLYCQIKINVHMLNEQQNDMIYLLIDTLKEVDGNHRKQCTNGSERDRESAYKFLYTKYYVEGQRKTKTKKKTQNDSYKKKEIVCSNDTLFKKLRQCLGNIYKIMQEISKFKLIDKHVPFNLDTKSQGAETLVLLESIGLIIGFQFLLGLSYDMTNREYYGHLPGKTIGGLSSFTGIKNYQYQNLQTSQVSRRF